MMTRSKENVESLTQIKIKEEIIRYRTPPTFSELSKHTLEKKTEIIKNYVGNNLNGWEVIPFSIKYIRLNILMKFLLRPSLDCTVPGSGIFIDDVILNGTVCTANNLTKLEKLRKQDKL